MKSISTLLFNQAAKSLDCYYHFTEEEIKAFKQCLLEIYLDVAKVCEKYNLDIILSGGSALGAVRHKGFIPWDDDVDTIMLRKDYNKLIEVFDKELGDKYILSVPDKDGRSNVPHMEVLKKNTLLRRAYSNTKDNNKIRIDIFPAENAPSNKFLQYIVAGIADSLRMIIGCRNVFKSDEPLYKKTMMFNTKSKLLYYARYFAGVPFSIIPRRYLHLLFYKFTSNIKGDKYIVIPYGRRYYNGEIWKKNVFFPHQKGFFEGYEVNIPNDVHAHLTRLYGDYMEIPPENKREQHTAIEFSLDTTKNK